MAANHTPVELLTTERFGSVFGFRVRDGLELKILRAVEATALQGDDVIEDVAWAVLLHLSGSRAGMGPSKFTLHRRAAVDSPIRISWTRRALPTERWNG
jgi:hypothetical protein